MALGMCTAQEKANVIAFYRDVSDKTDTMSAFGRWIYGVYPNDDILHAYLKKGQLYCIRDKEKICAAAALTDQNSSYHGIDWSIELQDDEVLVVHVLAVHPDYQHRGIARKMMTEVISMAKNANKKAIRLDALASNLPAHHLYESLGFEKRDVRHWYADNTGWTDFFLFELIL